MQTYKTLSDVIALAEFAHRNQTDKAGLPYIEHPRRVMQSVQAQGAFPYVQMAAMLHDVTEDTAFTPQMLLELGVPEAAVDIIKLLDRDYSKMWHAQHIRSCFVKGAGGNPIGLTPDEELAWASSAEEFYYSKIRQNPGALMVKLADIHDNTQEWRLLYLPEATQVRLREKYDKAKRLLGVL